MSHTSQFTAKKKKIHNNLTECWSLPLQEHNNRTDKTHHLALNKFADWHKDEFLATMLPNHGRPRPGLPLEGKQMLMHKPEVPEHMLPSTVDWRGTGADSPVKDQASCGSCWVGLISLWVWFFVGLVGWVSCFVGLVGWVSFFCGSSWVDLCFCGSRFFCGSHSTMRLMTVSTKSPISDNSNSNRSDVMHALYVMLLYCTLCYCTVRCVAALYAVQGHTHLHVLQLGPTPQREGGEETPQAGTWLILLLQLAFPLIKGLVQLE